MTNKSLIPSVASLWRTPAVNRFRSDMDDLFESFFADIVPSVKTFNDLQTNVPFPKINVAETEEEYVVDIAVAGFDKDDISLELKENTLFIKAEKKEKKEESDRTYLRKEISSRSFSRAVRFPEKTTSDVNASYKDGIVNVSIKKEIEKEEDCGIKININ